MAILIVAAFSSRLSRYNRKNGFYFAGGGIELPVLWAFAQVVQVFLGAGAFRFPLPGWLRLSPVFGTLL
jgi:hypothetical protein